MRVATIKANAVTVIHLDILQANLFAQRMLSSGMVRMDTWVARDIWMGVPMRALCASAHMRLWERM